MCAPLPCTPIRRGLPSMNPNMPHNLETQHSPPFAVSRTTSLHTAGLGHKKWNSHNICLSSPNLRATPENAHPQRLLLPVGMVMRGMGMMMRGKLQQGSVCHDSSGLKCPCDHLERMGSWHAEKGREVGRRAARSRMGAILVSSSEGDGWDSRYPLQEARCSTVCHVPVLT